MDSDTKRNVSSEADSDVLAKSLEERLDRGEEVQAFARGEVVGEDDLLDLFAFELVEVELLREM